MKLNKLNYNNQKNQNTEYHITSTVEECDVEECDEFHNGESGQPISRTLLEPQYGTDLQLRKHFCKYLRLLVLVLI